MLCSLTLLNLHRAAQTFVVKLYLLVLGFELLLKVANILLEFFLTLLVLALESQDLIVSLTSLASISESAFISSRRCLPERLNGGFHPRNAFLGEF